MNTADCKKFEIPRKDRIQFIEGFSDEERRIQADRIKRELSRKYGRDCVSQIRFVFIRWESFGDNHAAG